MPFDATSRSDLLHFIRGAASAEAATLHALRPILGGAVLQHWLVEVELHGGRFPGAQSWVLRADGRTPLGIGLDRAREFALHCLLFAAGMRVPEPLLLCRDENLSCAPFYLMRWMPGEAGGERLVEGGPREGLAETLGRELGKLHAIPRSWPELALLGPPPADAAQARIADYARHLAADDDPHPVAQWALRWLLQEAPQPAVPVLCHGDFRSGNYLARGEELVAILDWDFAGWGDPDEDIGWFCSVLWRFGALAREAGGIAPRAAFYRGYEEAARRRIDPARARYWEVMAALRWLVIALKQRDRFLRAGERSLDLALTGRRVAECELELLRLTKPEGEGR